MGPLPPPDGGVRLLFKSLADALAMRDDVAVQVLEISKGERPKWLNVLRLVPLLCRAARRARRCDVVSVHTTTSSLAYLGLFGVLVGRVSGRPVMLRKFGGATHLERPPGIDRPAGFVWRSFVRWVLRRVDAFLVETQAALQAARDDGFGQTVWYPNYRPMPDSESDPPPRASACERFIFVGSVRPDKGVRELIEAAERLPPNVQVDVYGPLGGGVDESTFSGLRRTRYRGVLAPEEVTATMADYDAFVLPTYHPGEGYPGVILEAMAAGIPTIATRWRMVPELVDEECGLLVDPQDSDDLFGAMQRLVEEPALFRQLRDGVRQRRKRFSAAMWVDAFVEYCKALASGQAFSGGAQPPPGA